MIESNEINPYVNIISLFIIKSLVCEYKKLWRHSSNQIIQCVNVIYLWVSIYNPPKLFRGLVKLKKNPRKTRIGQTAPNHPTPLSNFFLNILKHENYTKNTKKQKKSKKIIIIRVGLDAPTHPLPSFSRMFGFFYLDKAPQCVNVISHGVSIYNPIKSFNV